MVRAALIETLETLYIEVVPMEKRKSAGRQNWDGGDWEGRVSESRASKNVTG
jgi:hypothetical protein